MLSCHSNWLRVPGKEQRHAFSLWCANKVETYQANPISLLQVQPHDRFHCHGIEALVHLVLCSCDPTRGQHPDSLQSLRVNLEVLAGIEGADYREGDVSWRVGVGCSKEPRSSDICFCWARSKQLFTDQNSQRGCDRRKIAIALIDLAALPVPRLKREIA